jgi:hypothetical protein
MPMQQVAAIRRASQQARNAMHELDTAAVGELLQIYERAADEVRSAIAAQADAGGAVQLVRLQVLLQQIEDVVDRLGQDRDALLGANIAEAARLGVNPLTMQGVVAVGGSEAAIDSTAAMRINQRAVEFVRNFRHGDGLTLSERLWRLDQDAKEALRRAIGGAIVRGSSAARAAAELAYRGEPVPAATAQAAGANQASRMLRLADLLTSTKDGPGSEGSEVWKAERVFRTEINRAHGEAYMAGAMETRGFAGFRFLLSPMHPKADICDLLAAQNLHGLGPGVYPTRELTPWPAHPNTLSFVVIVFEDEISDADRAGKETELEALARMAPALRAGSIGETKAEYFDAGLLNRGMLRSSLRTVESRLRRQGRI